MKLMNSIFGRLRPEPLAPPVAATSRNPDSTGSGSEKTDQPVAASARIQFPNGLEYGGALILMVPVGKCLVIDAISFEGESRGGQGFMKATTSTGGHSMTYIIPGLNLNPITAADSVVGSASLHLYAGPGAAVMMTYYRGAGAAKLGVTSIRVSLSGHYVELKHSLLL
jgi:hypothetical protein